MQRPQIETYREAAEYIRAQLPQVPRAAVILGSGLDGLCARLEQTIVIPYANIPNFPLSTVSYQKGELLYGTIDGIPVLLMSGRFHYYEGWEMWQTSFPIVVFHLLGIDKLVITNAAGGINRAFAPGDFMVVRDHIKLAIESPLRGANEESLGQRFFNLQSVYDKDWIRQAKRIASQLGITLHEGVYAYMPGPQYETPAEIRALGVLGADAVGMSTVAEVIEAAHCGMRVFCVSSVSNMAAGITGEALSEQEVLDTAKENGQKFCALIDAMLHYITKQESGDGKK